MTTTFCLSPSYLFAWSTRNRRHENDTSAIPLTLNGCGTALAVFEISRTTIWSGSRVNANQRGLVLLKRGRVPSHGISTASPVIPNKGVGYLITHSRLDSRLLRLTFSLLSQWLQIYNPNHSQCISVLLLSPRVHVLLRIVVSDSTRRQYNSTWKHHTRNTFIAVSIPLNENSSTVVGNMSIRCVVSFNSHCVPVSRFEFTDELSL